MKKTAQGEGLGLVMIVAFIVFGIFFALLFQITQGPDLLSSQKLNTITATMIIGIFRTSIDTCPQYTVSDLVVDCYLTGVNAAGTGRVCDPFGPSPRLSCTAADDAITSILKGTLEDWGERYELVVLDDNGQVVGPFSYTSASDDCAVFTKKVPSILHIPAFQSGKTLDAILYICE